MIIIIGTGLAGYSVAKEFRKLDSEAPLTLITADDGINYSKPMLSNAVAKGKDPEALAMQSAEQMAETLNATIKTHARVGSIDTQNNSLTLEDGSTLEYSQLVMATGAQAGVPPIEGNGLADVYTVNSLTDYRRFYPELSQAARVVIIGPGLIGCEFANDIASDERHVDIVGPDKTPLSLLLPEEAGVALKEALESGNINFHLETLPTIVNKTDAGYQVVLNNGVALEADLVLSAVGLRPNIELAKKAGLECQRGIVTNRLLQTNVDNVYSLGDCVEIEGRILPYIMPIMHAARALAKTLAGTATEVSYPAMPVMIKTPAHPIVISSPAPDAAGEWQVERSEDGVKALFKDGDKLLGFALTGGFVKEKQQLTKELPPVLA